MKSAVSLRPGVIRVSIAASVLLHLVFLFALPVSVFTPLRTGNSPAAPEGPSEAGILKVMEIATKSFVVGDYSFAENEKPALPPEAKLDADVELPEDVAPVFAPVPGGGRAGNDGGGGNLRGETGRGGGGTATTGRYTPPVPVIMMWPRYPSSAQRTGVKGTVVVSVHVAADGSVDRAEVISGLEDRACREAALQAALKLRFLPALLDNRPVDAWFSYPVEFGKKR